MKIERIITLEEHEVNALKTLATIDCSAIPCHDCKFKLKAKDEGCLLNCIRSLLILDNIRW